jgi:nucleoside-diphosphate-sugar epimerase
MGETIPAAEPGRRRVCAVTGSNGYVGSRIASHLDAAGWEIRALCHSPASERHSRYTQVHFELGEELAPAALDGVDALIHLAYDFSLTRRADIERVNVEGSRRLLAAAHEAGVERIVTVSTLAAFPGARSLYGRAKLEIERTALDLGAAIVRPGLVWGPQGAALFGTLQRAVQRLPVVPLPAPAGLVISLVHEDDLALLTSRLLDRWPAGSGKLFVAASAQTLTFGELLRSFASRADSRPRFMRLPWTAVWLGLRVLERVGARPPFRSDSLISLVSIDDDPFPRATDSAERYDVCFRPYAVT